MLLPGPRLRLARLQRPLLIGVLLRQLLRLLLVLLFQLLLLSVVHLLLMFRVLLSLR